MAELSNSGVALLLNSDEAPDLAYLLHGYTNAVAHRETGPVITERGQGVYVYDNHGEQYLEGIAGLWITGPGFSEPSLIVAATAQMQTLSSGHRLKNAHC